MKTMDELMDLGFSRYTAKDIYRSFESECEARNNYSSDFFTLEEAEDFFGPAA